jgi:hypothetical protein
MIGAKVDLSCKEAARLMSQRQDRLLSEAEAIALKDHLHICLNCRKFDQQMDFLRRLARRYAEGKIASDPE